MPRTSPRTSLVVAAGCALMGSLVAGMSACGTSQSADDGRFTVAVAFYPIEEMVRRVGGEAVRVVTIVPPGEEAHEYEPTPKQVAALESADVVFYLGNGFQPNVEKAIAGLPSSVHRVDLLEVVELLPITDALPGTDGATEGEVLADGSDPHVWLAPANMRTMLRVVADTMVTNQVTPDSWAELQPAATEAYDAELQSLDEQFRDGLAECRSTQLVTGHRAFAYLAQAYGLTQVAIAGISPGDEPSAKTLQAIAEFAAANDVRTIFFEANLPPDLARTVADEIGAATAALHTLETLSADQLAAGDDYVSVMTQNLTALQDGLGCA
ncbi:MAG: zinc ABC transporter substrate-binding protein [Actinomycetota bacterium]|nr:zinc ABC transporter substrate-binding protein [Actinomycetota bacterium]